MPKVFQAARPAFARRETRTRTNRARLARAVAVTLAAGMATTTYAVSTMAANAAGPSFRPPTYLHAGLASATVRPSGSAVGFAARPGLVSGWVAYQDGAVVALGGAPALGSAPTRQADVVGIAATADGNGYWLATASGRVLHFGDAGTFAGPQAMTTVVGIAAGPAGRGYWLLDSAGNVYPYGAPFHGEASGDSRSFSSISATPDHRGYWLLATDGTVMGFGDARSYKAPGGTRRSFVAMAAQPDGKGLWAVGSDGTVARYGQAPAVAAKVVGSPAALVPSPTGSGYLELLRGGQLRRYGQAMVMPTTSALFSKWHSSTLAATTNLTSDAGPVTQPQAALVRTGYLGSALLQVEFSPASKGDLVVAAVVNDTWAQHVASVSGGGVDSWLPAGAPFFDGGDGQIMQLFYGLAARTSRSALQVRFSGTVDNADLAVEEFAAGRRAQWTLVSDGNAGSPFPSLSAPSGGGVYVGAAMAWGNAAAGNTAGFGYLVPNANFVVATSPDTSGQVQPTATGAGSVAAVFAATSTAKTTSSPAPDPQPTTVPTTAPTTTTTAATTTAGGGGGFGGGGTTTTAPPAPATTTSTAPSPTSTQAPPTTAATTTSTPATTTPTTVVATTSTTRGTTTTTAATTTTGAVTSTTAVPPTTAATTSTTRATTTTTRATTTTTAAATTTTTAPPTTTTTAPPTTTTTVSLGGYTPPASLMPNSLFNSNVTSWPVDANSAEYANDFVNDYQTHYGSVGVNSAPIYNVPTGTALSSISVTSGCNDFTPSTGTEVPIPSYVSLNGSGDNPLILYQASSHSEWEFWQMKQLSATSYSACWGGKLDLATSDGVFPWPYGLSATGISYLATTITENDVKSGSIDHAIAVILPRCNYSTYPADRGDCGSDPGQPSEGQWFRFAPGTTCSPSECFNPFATMVFNAIKTYGMVVIDQGGAVMIEAEQPSDWAAQGGTGTDPILASWQGYAEYQVVADLPWNDLQVVDPPQ